MVKKITSLLAVLLFSLPSAEAASEEEFYKLVTLPVPENLKLEVSGLSLLPDGRLAAAIRKGEIWILNHVYDDTPTNVVYRQFASGLHEPLGLAWRDGSFYTAQRGELTRIHDRDGDGVADEYLTVATGWGLTGNYHEYAYGPVFDRAGNAWLTLNITIGDAPGKNDAWRGWSLRVKPDGEWEPVSGGFRSPSGIGLNADGEIFASEQQGNWFAAGALLHVQKGVFHGHASALKSCQLPGATFAHPGKLPENLTVGEAAKKIPAFKLPAVWLPYRKMGMSATDVLCDTTGGKFGPFTNQLFVGEFTQSAVNRVFLEKINGEYQGACFPFRKDFQSAVLRFAWGRDGSLFCGESNRGWNSLGTRAYGLQRLVWTGRTPFEIKTMQVQRDGFLLTFTLPVQHASASDAASYRLSSYTYQYHSTYGGAEIDPRELPVKEARVSADGLQVRLVVEGLREGYVHELVGEGIKSSTGQSLLHNTAYYTLNQLPH